MGLHSGKWAAVDGISTVHQWTINETQAPAVGRASNTAMGPVRKRGIHSWTGSYQAYGAVPACMPGALFGFVGYGAPDDDVSGSGQRYSGNALVNSISLMWNWGSGEYLGHTVAFDGHLELSKTQGDMPADSAAPDMPPVALTTIKTGASGATVDGDYSVLANVVSATLNITMANQSFVNTSTVVGTGSNAKLWTGRKAGIPDWNLALAQQDNLRVGAPFDIGDNISIRLYADPTTYWLLKWGHVRDFSGITADRNSGAILARTINLDMNSIISGTTLGVVTDPTGTDWWPFP